MTHTPSIDYSCSHCGASQTYRIVPGDPEPQREPTGVASREIPSIDVSCSRCGAIETYRLVPVSVTAASKQ